MKTETVIAPERIRLLFELDRADNPRLYDDLIGFKKGTKRVNRLRTLAHEGLLLSQPWPSDTPRKVSPKGSTADWDAQGSDQIFGDPLKE